MNLKQIAVNFLNLAAKGDVRQAFSLYVGKDFKHHNAYFKGDADALMVAMEESAKTNPNKVFEIQRALQDEDLVAVHSRILQAPENRELAVMHICRFEEDKIVELWDFGQVVPKDMVNENGMF